MVRRPEERINFYCCSSIAATFNKFVRDAGLLELNMGGRKFTYFSDVGCKLSKLDRFLVCPNFMSAFTSASIVALPREHSDHSPILLRTKVADFGPRPFRLFNFWLLRDDFDGIIRLAWSDYIGVGAPDRYFSNKLKVVKEAIRNWRRVEFDKENRKLRELKDLVNNIELVAENKPLTNVEIEERRLNKQHILDLEKFAKLDLIQKAKIKWVCDEDENSWFFHNYLKIKNRKCNIHGLMINGIWTTDVDAIKKKA